MKRTVRYLLALLLILQLLLCACGGTTEGSDSASTEQPQSSSQEEPSADAVLRQQDVQMVFERENPPAAAGETIITLLSFDGKQAVLNRQEALQEGGFSVPRYWGVYDMEKKQNTELKEFVVGSNGANLLPMGDGVFYLATCTQETRGEWDSFQLVRLDSGAGTAETVWKLEGTGMDPMLYRLSETEFLLNCRIYSEEDGLAQHLLIKGGTDGGQLTTIHDGRYAGLVSVSVLDGKIQLMEIKDGQAVLHTMDADGNQLEEQTLQGGWSVYTGMKKNIGDYYVMTRQSGNSVLLKAEGGGLKPVTQGTDVQFAQGLEGLYTTQQARRLYYWTGQSTLCVFDTQTGQTQSLDASFAGEPIQQVMTDVQGNVLIHFGTDLENVRCYLLEKQKLEEILGA